MHEDEIIYVPFEALHEEGSLITFRGIFTAKKCGKINYGIRIIPHHPDVDDVFDLGCIYLYGLLSIASKKIYNIPRWKAFLAALPPILVLIAVNVIFNIKLLPKIGNMM